MLTTITSVTKLNRELIINLQILEIAKIEKTDPPSSPSIGDNERTETDQHKTNTELPIGQHATQSHAPFPLLVRNRTYNQLHRCV